MGRLHQSRQVLLDTYSALSDDTHFATSWDGCWEIHPRAHFLTLALGFSSNGEYLLVPDLTSLRVAPYAQHHAVVMCYLQEKFPSPEHGRVVPIDPRTLLKRVIE